MAPCDWLLVLASKQFLAAISRPEKCHYMLTLGSMLHKRKLAAKSLKKGVDFVYSVRQLGKLMTQKGNVASLNFNSS